MIRLTSKTIQPATEAHLVVVQKAIQNEPTFADQAKKASLSWDSKASSQAGQDAFTDVKTTLISMSVGVGICVYCETNEGADIEHIFPKKIYPEKAFSWDNYVWACKNCNTKYKSDNFKVFNPKDSTNELDVKPPRGTYLKPPTDDALFINQRIEDPMDLLELDLVAQQFIFKERYPIGTREYLKAKYTKDLLGLNARAALVVARRNATKYFRDRLGKYVEARNANDFAELAAAIDDDFGGVDATRAFAGEKDRITAAIKKDVLEYPHPTVWKELMRQRANLPRINSLVNQTPEVLTWLL